MAYYAFHDLALEVGGELSGATLDLERLLEGMSFERVTGAGQAPAIRLMVASAACSPNIPTSAREAFRADGFSVLNNGGECFVTDGESLLHLQPDLGRGTAHIASSFGDKSPLLQSSFWAYGLMKLVRRRGFYPLHGAGLVSPEGLGIIITGPCGSGKSTLSIGLIRAGWAYLTDDALLMRETGESVEIVGLRKAFYIDDCNAPRYADLSPGPVVRDHAGGLRRQLSLHQSHPGRYVPRARADILLFPRIVPESSSALRPLHGASALSKLLAESGGQLFDRSMIGGQLHMLKRLLDQTRSFELLSGQDLYRDPGQLAALLADAGV